MKNRNEKQFVLSILLVVVILGIGTTIALSTAISKPVVNSFQAADHETNIKEEIDGLKKTIQVKNTADKSAAFVRVRIVISPAKAPRLLSDHGVCFSRIFARNSIFPVMP